MRRLSAHTAVIRIYLSGPIEIAKHAMREECCREGLCVTIEPTTFIYTGGEEEGYCVGLVNYPRFPTTNDALFARARRIAELLLDRTFQQSALVLSADLTEWITKRETDSMAPLGAGARGME